METKEMSLREALAEVDEAFTVTGWWPLPEEA